MAVVAAPVIAPSSRCTFCSISSVFNEKTSAS
jgi:hypothetical protein